MVTWLKARYKGVTAVIGALAVLGVALAPANKWVAVVVAVATALGVYAVPNKTAAPAAAVTVPPEPPAA